MKIIIMALALLLSTSVFAIDYKDADRAGFGNLSETEKAAIIAEIESKSLAKAPKAIAAVATVEKVDKWVDVGSKIGRGLGGAAKELGVAVNDFAKTPVGNLVTWLLIFHFIGGAAIHVIGALVFWSVGFGGSVYIMRRLHPAIITYDVEGKKVKSTTEPLDQSEAVGFMFAYGVILMIGIFIMFSW